MLNHALTTRAATPCDGIALSRLAGSASRPSSSGHALLAERDGVPIAAIALTSGMVFADPLTPTIDAVRLLRFRRYRLLRQGGDVGSARNVIRRLTPAA